MNVNAAGKAAAILIFFSLFSACGELETLIPSRGSYQVKALVNGKSLESCSIIRSDDQICPYFTVSVANDPDLIGLLVYFQNSQGEIIGEKIRYILQSYAEEAKPAKTKIGEEVKTDTTDDEIFEETQTIEEVITEEITNEIEAAEESAVQEQQAGKLPEQGAVQGQKPSTDAKPAVKNTRVDIVVKSLLEELPYLPLPKTLEIGPYTLVFEAIGVRETLSLTETSVFYLDSAEFSLKDILMYLPSQSGSQLISPGTTVMLETRLDFDSRLDPYIIWYNGKNIISEGKISGGAGTILWKAPEQAGFYSLRLAAFPFQIKQIIYTGVSREVTLPVSPKAGNLCYFFENNREYAARSPLAAGTAYPEQVRLITAINSAKNIDNPKEKSAPAKPSARPPTLPPPPELLRWYQFEGSLIDATTPLNDTQSLLPVTKKAPRWAAAGQSYGLSTGSDDIYSLSPINFFQKQNDQGGGIFLFHIMPAAEGTIFSAFFPLQSSSTDGVWMNMVRKGNSITLHLNAENTIVEMPVYLSFSEPQGLIPIIVEFYIRPYRLEAKLSVSEGYSLKNKVGSIRLPDALSGEGRIRLGGVMDRYMIDKSMVDKSKVETSPKVQPSAPSMPNVAEPPFEKTLAAITDNAEKDAGITAASEKPLPQTLNQNTIWDEFAVLFSAIPLLEEEFAAPVAVEAQNTAGARTAESKSESPVPAVQDEAAADYKSDYKSETGFESAITEIPMPDTDETKTSAITSD